MDEKEANEEVAKSWTDHFEDENRAQKISLKLIMDRNLTAELVTKATAIRQSHDSMPSSSRLSSSQEIESDLKARALFNLTHVHLDRERIDEIDGLEEYFGPRLTHLYLQCNRISRIENLSALNNLKFLILSNNFIEKIENLTGLCQLQLLDLSHNRIAEVDVEQLPVSLCFLDLRENRFAVAPEEIEKRLRQRLVNLIELNGDLIDENGEDDVAESDNKAPVIEDIEKLKARIIDSSKQRQEGDVVKLDQEWQQKKLKLNSIQQILNEKFNF